MINTELYIEGYLVELTEDIDIPLTFSVSNIKDPSKRNASFSKTVRIPGTKSNNQLFGNTHDVQVATQNLVGNNIGTNFNRKKKAEFLLIVDGSNLMTGVVQMTGVTVNNDKITYDVVLYGELVNIINELGDSELTDLSGSALSHDYTIENIETSWSGSTDYVYPLIDYGLLQTRMESVTMSNFRPAVYVSWYWDQIFENAGFTYEGDFFNSDLFNKLIIPYNREEWQRADKKAPAMITTSGRIGTEAIQVAGTEHFIFDRVVEDSEQLYIVGTETYVANETEKYSAVVSYNGPLFMNPDNGQTVDDVIVNDRYMFTCTAYVNNVSVETRSYEIPRGTYSTIVEAGGFTPAMTDRLSLAFLFSQIDLSANDELRFSLKFELDVGLDYFWNVTDQTSLAKDDFGFSYALTEDESSLNIEYELFEGSELVYNDFVPRGIKQRDILLGILKMFNLYIEPDRDQPRHLIIKQRDSYYSEDTDSKDWTYKLAKSNDIQNDLVSDTLIQSLQFKFNHDDEDFFLTQYKNKWGREYGEKRVDTGYYFSKEVKDILKLPFSPVVPIQYAPGLLRGDTRIEVLESEPDKVRILGYTQIRQDDPGESSLELPRFRRAFIGRRIQIGEDIYTITDLISPWEIQVDSNITATGSGTFNGIEYRVFNRTYLYVGLPNKVIPAILSSDNRGATTEPFDSELRIAVFNGAIDCNAWTIQQTPIRLQTSVKYLYNNDITKSDSFTVYPFTSHILGSSPLDGTMDLLFERPQQLFWNIISIDDTGVILTTDGGLFLTTDSGIPLII